MSGILSRILNIFGSVMAAVLLAAIILWIAGAPSALPLTRLGILLAIAIPFIAVGTSMIILLKHHETNYAVCATILLVVILVTVVWRMIG
jgi:hypothetical protein